MLASSILFKFNIYANDTDEPVIKMIKQFRKNSKKLIPHFNPVDISLKDDAFHIYKGRFYAEWWYFDAVFDNGYSLNAVFMSFSRGKLGLVVPILTIYKDLELIFNQRKLFCNREFVASEETPYVEISKKNIMKSRIDNVTNSWIYNVAMKLGGQKIDLKFTGFMKGWKGETPVSKWSVVLPKAKVKGTITFDGKQIEVIGTGYHDHNWELGLPIKQKGWFWGRVEGDLLNLVWSKIMLNKSEDYLLGVLNFGNSDYINIKPDKINFTEIYSDVKHKKGIPSEFVLLIKDEYNSVNVNINMKTIKAVHHLKSPIMNYWRGHVQTTGHIIYGNHSEKIDRVQMIEYFKMR